MPRLLLCGFEPFGSDSVNPALHIIEALDGQRLALPDREHGSVEIIACRVPVTRFAAIDSVVEAIGVHAPDVVIMLGQASGRSAITPERIAINLDDYRIADNGGHQPVDEPVEPGGPDGCFTTLPIKAMVSDLQAAGLPASVSYSAGTFVCNHLFYGIQRHLADSPIRSGFVHIPALPEQSLDGRLPTMSLDSLLEGVRTLCLSAMSHHEDVRIGGGNIS
ncbi:MULTISPECIES: pyroglutamyl-peptidase I [Cobetia]|uniref:Pyrrolidone-carboxylate peptidase n=1 Tax=Cobetia crustatorum TaxID=553385 RepID=A0A558HX61_9GAMM|nr:MULTISPECIES: pyroglutamyl-peptidase I [Cobetia]TVU73712.1 pyroglutamyl-peptidase I [Cobetia crustatorum]